MDPSPLVGQFLGSQRARSARGRARFRARRRVFGGDAWLDKRFQSWVSRYRTSREGEHVEHSTVREHERVV